MEAYLQFSLCRIFLIGFSGRISFTSNLLKPISILVWTLTLSEAKIYDRCEVASALRNAGVPEDQVSTWVCIANAESHFDTTAINRNTWDYGIFQISSIYWCNSGDTPGERNIFKLDCRF